jgi:sporadic carbohydrate cluster protein (TIGR04323 family)
MKTLQGYIFSRPFMGERAPQHVQNIVIRDYCQKTGYKFALSATEYAMAGSFLILNQIIDNIEELDGIVAYSVFQLPTQNDVRKRALDKVLARKKEFHFAVENIIVHDLETAERVDRIWKIKHVSTNWLAGD